MSQSNQSGQQLARDNLAKFQSWIAEREVTNDWHDYLRGDKLNRSEQARALQIARLQAGGGSVMLFSAPKRQGVEDAATWLRAVVDAAANPSDAA